MVVIRVDHELEVVGLHVAVAAHEPRDDVLRPVLLVHPRADVERFVVVEEPNLGALRPRLALFGIDLRELGDRRGLGPAFLVDPAVDQDVADAFGGRQRWGPEPRASASTQ